LCEEYGSTEIQLILFMLFEYLDNFLSELPIIMKIECFGDSYMLTGEIYSEESQTTVHARKAVDFSLCANEVPQRINKRKGTKLQIQT
jgi:hypothetical protein